MKKPAVRNIDQTGLSGSCITRDGRQVNFIFSRSAKMESALLISADGEVALVEDRHDNPKSLVVRIHDDLDFFGIYDMFWQDNPITESHALILDAVIETIFFLAGNVGIGESDNRARRGYTPPGKPVIH